LPSGARQINAHVMGHVNLSKTASATALSLFRAFFFGGSLAGSIFAAFFFGGILTVFEGFCDSPAG